MQFIANPQASVPIPLPSPPLPWAALARRASRLLTRPVVAPCPLRRIFVVGCPRSGTTIVQAALAERANLLTLPETHFFSRLLGALEDWISADFARCSARWHSRLLCARASTHRELNRALAGPLHGRRLARHFSGRAYAAEFLQMLDDAASKQHRAGWLEKTPEHFVYIEMIHALCPDACFVHVMRSGEDVVASAVDAEMRFAERDGLRGGAAFWVRRWNRAAETHLRYAGRPGHFVVCHEDLVRDSDGVLARLAAFTGLEDEAPRVASPAEIADLRREPWKREALSGGVAPPERKFEALFGPQAQRWIRERLHGYDALRAEIAARQAGARR